MAYVVFQFPARLHKLLIASLLGVLLASCSGSGKDQIAVVYDSFVSNVSAGRGHNAAKYVTDDSISRYEELRQLALYGGNGINALPIHDEVTVYLLREHFEKSALQKMSDRDVFNYAVMKGMIGPSDFLTYTLGEMRTTDTEARIDLLKEGEKTPYSIFFRLQDGKWKVRTRLLQSNLNDALQQRIFQFGGNRDEIVNELLKSHGKGSGLTSDLRRPLAG